MAKTTVAELETRVNELEELLNQALHVNQYQTRALADAVREVKRAHGRLDQASDVIRGLKESGATTTTSKPRNTKTTFDCPVENCPGHKNQATVAKHQAYVAK